MDDNSPLVERGLDDGKDDQNESPSIYDQGASYYPTRSVGVSTNDTHTRAVGVSTSESIVERMEEDHEDVPIDQAVNIGRSRDMVEGGGLGLEVCVMNLF